ncbi:MAG: hypothetical protein AB7O24_15640 [Kofleriaceae bacterium]
MGATQGINNNDWLRLVTSFTARATTETNPWAAPSDVSVPLSFAPAGTQITARSCERTLVLHRHGSWFQLDGNEPIVLQHRPLLGRVLVMLAEHHAAASDPTVIPTGVSGRELFAAAWQGQLAHDLSARKRVRSAIWALRKHGLRDFIITRGDSYSIPPSVAICWTDDPPPR